MRISATQKQSEQILVSAVGVTQEILHISRTLYLSEWTKNAYDITMILFLISNGHILTPPVYTLACLDWHKFASIEPSSSWILLHKHWSDFLLKYNDAQFSCAFVKKNIDQIFILQNTDVCMFRVLPGFSHFDYKLRNYSLTLHLLIFKLFWPLLLSLY